MVTRPARADDAKMEAARLLKEAAQLLADFAACLKARAGNAPLTADVVDQALADVVLPVLSPNTPPPRAGMQVSTARKKD
jgi:hypothetical protein